LVGLDRALRASGPPRDPSPRVCIVVLNFNGMHHLEYCLPSVLATDYPNCQVVVVDNASVDGSVEYVRKEFPGVTLLTSSVNRGWSGGNNLGIRFALDRGARYIALANNDIKVDPRWIRLAVNLAEKDPRVGIVGFRILLSDQRFEQEVSDWRETQARPAIAPTGCALLVRSELFERIGLIDESFFVYCEEVDFAYRAARAGYRIAEINSPVWHARGATLGAMPIRAGRLAMRSQIRFAVKHMGPLAAIHNVLSVARLACSPFPPKRPMTLPLRRFRPSNVMVNTWLFLRALAWNLGHLPGTLRRRRLDRRLADDARRRTPQAG